MIKKIGTHLPNVNSFGYIKAGNKLSENQSSMLTTFS